MLLVGSSPPSLQEHPFTTESAEKSGVLGSARGTPRATRVTHGKAMVWKSSGPGKSQFRLLDNCTLSEQSSGMLRGSHELSLLL